MKLSLTFDYVMIMSQTFCLNSSCLVSVPFGSSLQAVLLTETAEKKQLPSPQIGMNLAPPWYFLPIEFRLLKFSGLASHSSK